jgi:disease resistance protein RPM1
MAPSVFPYGAMPRLEEFKFPIRLEDYANGKFTGDDLALCHLPFLKSVGVDLTGMEGVSKEVVMEVEEKLRHEAERHPSKPNIRFEDYYF